ncbi:DUF2239 family protein [Reyranella sp.]|uniref:DUF2239 family protein n=1 Tax=Reyranella sp. TaxID=1929291 RepID=UPI0011FD98B4|nr:DUF2239 family protein [Reyranella sp.]TAJ90819.1 MAG: DUF2239 family protein [Reyranella sp.]
MTNDHASASYTAFEGSRLLFAGPLVEVVLAVKAATERGTVDPVLVFDDATGRALDFDLRGTRADVIERLSLSQPSPERRGRGRPKLGVIGREVTLLPRHWEWLAAQPGGASVALRKLVDEARRTGGPGQALRAAKEAAYRFMSAMAGNLPGFEEAARALFANDRPRFEQHVSDWPDDIRTYATRLAFQPQEIAAP